MKLNKISDALRKQGKSALYTSAMLSMLAAPAYVQAAEEAQAVVADDVEVIEVTGMRGTMTRSLNEKKNTAAIVDAIAAADFGDLPGLSLSDVIENVSGATGHREKGSQNEISIRGLGSYWGNATFNGRTITNAGPNRAVNFKKFPSELIDKVVVYKTQQADLVEGGISGTIEVGSLRAVDYGKSKTSVEYQAAYNDYYNDANNQSEWGHKITFSTVQSWETESLGDMGFSFGYVWNDSANPEEVYTTSSTMGACSFVAADGSALSWSDDGKKCFDTRSSSRQDTAVSFGRTDRLSLGPNALADTDTTPGYIDQGLTGDEHLANFDQDSIFFMQESSTWRTTKDSDKRSSVVATFQWVPNDVWDINFDLAASRLKYEEERMELVQERAAGLIAETLIFDDNGIVLYEEGEGKVSLQSESRSQEDDYNGYGIVIEHQVNDNFELTLDLSYNESKRNRIRNVTRLRSDNEVAYSLDSRGDVPALYFGDELTNEEGAEFYYKNVNGELVENASYDGPAFDPTKFNHFTSLYNGSSGADYRWTRAYERRKDDVWAIKTDGLYMLDDNDYIASIKAGVRYSREHLYNVVTSTALTPDGVYVNGTPSSTGYYETTASNIDQATLDRVASCDKNDQNFDGFMDRQNDVGQASEFFTYDAKCFIGSFLAGVDGYDGPDVDAEGYFPTQSFYDIGENPNYEDKDGDEFDVREDIMAAYVMANIDAEIMGYPVTGNVGLRYVKTDTKSKSYSNGTSITLVEDAEYTYEDEFGNPVTEYFDYYQTSSTGNQRTYLNGSYTEFLPSMNLTIALDDEWQFKIAAYRAMSRYPMQNMSAGVTTTTCGDEAPTSPTDSCVDLEDQVSAIQETGSMFDPFTSSNYDLSLEWYPSQDMAITLGAYWKDFTGGAETTTSYHEPSLEQVVVDVDGLDPTYQEVQFNGRGIAKDETTIKGFELTWQKHFVELPEPFNGMGIKGAWNHAVSDFETIEEANYGISPDANLWGFSEDTAAASIYWEGEKLSMRLMYKYRSHYYQPTNLFDEKSNRFVDDAEFVDASIKYKITKGLDVSLKALNLLEETKTQYRGTGTVHEVSQSGRKLFFGVKAKF